VLGHLQRGCAGRLERARDVAVKPDPHGVGDVVVERGPDHLVGEPEPAVVIPKDAGLQRRLDGRVELHRSPAGHLPQLGQRERTAEHRGETQHLRGRGTELGEAMAYRDGQ
jgi:hypothetical protein